MATTETKVEIMTVADLIAALEKIEDKTAALTVSGKAGGDHWNSPEEFNRTIQSIQIDSWELFQGVVELKI